MIKIDKNFKGDVWIFSDPHYNHTNICRGTTKWRLPDGSLPIKQTRDFPNLEKMNSAIVDNINQVVKQGDILICLGDWSFGGFESIKEFWDRIICKNIHLILGNHDHHIENNRENCQDLFLSVSHYNTLVIGEHKFQLMHYPISSWDGLNKGFMHLHGHCHLPTHMRFGKGQRMDVGVDGHPEFRPYHIIREVVPMLKKRPIMSEMDGDHHTDEITGRDKG
jgi:calcineurin-like phosphoesterase family protein